MELLIKCSAASRGTTAACGFTVRRSHRIVHAASALAKPTDAAAAALHSAVAWLQSQPVMDCRVILRTALAPAPAAVADLLDALTNSGWTIDLQFVSAEWVSEATALCRRFLHAAAGCPEEPEPAPGQARSECSSPDLAITVDGGFKPGAGAGGLAVYGCLVRKHNRLVHRECGIVCRGPAASSQLAELGATVAALRWLATSPVASGSNASLRSDCQAVVETLRGLKCHRLRRGTVMLLRTAQRLLARLERSGCRVDVQLTPRRGVAEADKLCWRAYASPAARDQVPVKAFLKGRGA